MAHISTGGQTKNVYVALPHGRANLFLENAKNPCSQPYVAKEDLLSFRSITCSKTMPRIDVVM